MDSSVLARIRRNLFVRRLFVSFRAPFRVAISSYRLFRDRFPVWRSLSVEFTIVGHQINDESCGVTRTSHFNEYRLLSTCLNLGQLSVL